MNWKPIDTARYDIIAPIIVWLPSLKRAVSALSGNVLYSDDGNIPIGWDGDPWFTMTDSAGEAYGLALEDSPSHWMEVDPPN